MSGPRLVAILFAAALPFLASESIGRACRVLQVDFTPSADLQIVMWLEDAQGNFVQTLYITRAVGAWGLGNRPGMMNLNSAFLWPYGRRESTFPIWSHRHGRTYPRVVFQDGQEDDVSHPFSQSSPESTYCRPFKTGEAVLQDSIDTGTCATASYTDKGRFADGETSLYPPRADITRKATSGSGPDHEDVTAFADVNDVDQVSRATPAANLPAPQFFSIHPDLPEGDYVVWVEVAKEFDQNGNYSYPSPTTIPYAEYGEPYRGQPSVVWRVPIAFSSVPTAAAEVDYAGYGDPDGLDGMLRIPDGTITSGVEGSGANRLLLASGPEGSYRVRAAFTPGMDSVVPGNPGELEIVELRGDRAMLSFVESGDDGATGSVTSYEVRVSPGDEMTVANFGDMGMAGVNLVPGSAGGLQTMTVTGLRPETHYWIGVRAHDDCLNHSAPTIVHLVTPRLEGGEVSTCFVATAAFGSPLAADVTLLRGFRDRALRRVAIGEMLVESYYTFGPGLAAFIRPSDPLRSLARTALGPVVDLVRDARTP